MSKLHAGTSQSGGIPPALNLQLTQLQLGKWFPDCEQDWQRFSSEAHKALEYATKTPRHPLDSQFIGSLATFTRYLYVVKLAADSGPLPLSSEGADIPSVQSVREKLFTRLASLDTDIERVLAQTGTDDATRESLKVISSAAKTLAAGMLQSIQPIQDLSKEID